MKNIKKVLWVVLVFALLFSLPNVFQRHQSEWKNSTYELIIPYQDIETISRDDEELSVSNVLERFKNVGLQAVSIEPETLKSLHAKGDITFITSDRMKELLLFDDQISTDGIPETQEGIYVHIQKDDEVTNNIETVFETFDKEEFNIDDKEFLFIEGKESKILNTPLGYSREAIEDIRNSQLAVVFRIGNDKTAESNEVVANELVELSDAGIDKILFLGKEITGSPNADKIKAFGDAIKEKELSVYGIEFNDQKGFQTLANQVEMDIIRLHSLDIKKDEPKEVAIRAVKERNIRSIFINLDENDGSKKMLTSAEKLMKNIKEDMPAKFSLGSAAAFSNISLSFIGKLFTLVSAVLFISIAVLELTKRTSLFYLSLGIFTVLSLGSLILDKILINQGLALLVSVVTPVYAILSSSWGREKDKLILTFLQAVAKNIIGILIMVALLNGNEFLTKVEVFRGVILTYSVPILFIALFVIKGHIKGILKQFISYGHVIILALIAAIGFYYIMRSGNSGTVSDIELAFRQWLENTFYVRPRTKEFLIGFPAYVLGLHLLMKKNKWGIYLFIPGVIGFLSMVNTFSHLHIPLYVSILRSFYSIVLGLLIGYVFIFIYEKGRILLKRYMDKRESL